MKDILQSFGIYDEQGIVTEALIDLIMTRMDDETKKKYCSREWLDCDESRLREKLIRIYAKGRM